MRAEAGSKGLSHGRDQFTQAYLSMLGGALAFAVMGAASHLAGERCDWRIIALARSSLALVFSLTIALSSGVRLVFPGPAILWVRSLSGSLGVLFAFYALTHLPISTAITLTNTFPVWVTLLAWAVLKHRPTRSVWAAVATGVAGVALVQQPFWSGSKVAVLAALGNSLSTAVSMIGLNRLGGVDPRAVVVHFSAVSTLFSLAFLLLSGGGIDYSVLADGQLLAMLAGVGLAGTLGQLGMTRAFALGAPSKVSVVGLTQIVFAFLFDLLLWKHTPGLVTVCGILLVIAPTAWLLVHNPLKRRAAIHASV